MDYDLAQSFSSILPQLETLVYFSGHKPLGRIMGTQIGRSDLCPKGSAHTFSLLCARVWRNSALGFLSTKSILNCGLGIQLISLFINYNYYIHILIFHIMYMMDFLPFCCGSNDPILSLICRDINNLLHTEIHVANQTTHCTH